MAAAIGDALQATPAGIARSEVVGRGEGGDSTTAIDRLAEDIVVRELEALERGGASFRLVSEELGERDFGGGGPVTVIVDPVDGSLNAKRGLPFYCLSVAVAEGSTIGDVRFGAVHDLANGEAWLAERGRGATLDGRRLGTEAPRDPFEVVLLEATVGARRTAAAAAALEGHCSRLRLLGALALALCQIADGRADALATLTDTRPLDIAAAQLVVREAGFAVIAPDEPGGLDGMPLDLARRSTVYAACDEAAARRLARLLAGTMPA
jgi:myo-inositol-1(or 4)-monophosphatase